MLSLNTEEYFCLKSDLIVWTSIGPERKEKKLKKQNKNIYF